MLTIKQLIVSLALSIICLSSFAGQDRQKTVLVTGASTGIGLRITEVLSAKGYLVYAGARKEADLKRLDAMKNVESVRLDVTVQEQIDAAVVFVESKGRGLDALVNNAGIAVLGPLLEVPVEELEWQFEVNVYGPHRVTQAFAPLIKQSKGRITTMGSISGTVSGAMFGPYSMSKHAVEAYTDSLATEMGRFGVKVSIIEPGNYQSNIGKTFFERLLKKGYWDEGTDYADELEGMKYRLGGSSEQKDPKEVADAVEHALFSENPKRRYLVTPNAGQATYTINTAMQEMLQLNQDHPYSLKREQLIEMMDKLLAEL